MKRTVKKNCEEVIVHTMSPLQGRGPVYYAAFPLVPESSTRPGTKKEEAKHCLVSALWEHLAAREGTKELNSTHSGKNISRRDAEAQRDSLNFWFLKQRRFSLSQRAPRETLFGSSLSRLRGLSAFGKQPRCSSSTAFPLQILSDPLGKPALLVGTDQGPAISFSEGGGKVWAALVGDESALGIDVAGSEEFQKAYPVHRVFHPEELRHALRSTKGNWEMASALLWSVKEAVVKALGCAFHLVEPRQLTVSPTGDEDTFTVGLSGKALNRFPLAAQEPLYVRSFVQEKMWLSIAVFNRSLAGNA